MAQRWPIELLAHASSHVDGGADEIVSKLDFRAMNILQAKTVVTTTFSTTSTGFVDVTGMSVNITLPAAAVVLVFSSTYQLLNNTAGAQVIQQLMRGTTALRSQQQTSPTALANVNSLIQTLDINVSAATYTYKLRGAVSSGTGTWAMTGIPTHGEIVVIAYVY